MKGFWPGNVKLHLNRWAREWFQSFHPLSYIIFLSNFWRVQKKETGSFSSLFHQAVNTVTLLLLLSLSRLLTSFLTTLFPALVLPVLLVSTGWDADGWKAVVHEAESHRTTLWPEQLPHDQQIHRYSLRRGLEVTTEKEKINILKYGWLNVNKCPFLPHLQYHMKSASPPNRSPLVIMGSWTLSLSKKEKNKYKCTSKTVFLDNKCEMCEAGKPVLMTPNIRTELGGRSSAQVLQNVKLVN